MSAFRNKPIDQRYLSDQDKENYLQGGGYASQVKAYKRARAYKGNLAYAANAPKRTTKTTPGTGGFTVDMISQNQQRLLDKGESARSAKSFKPDLDDSIYDIYQG